MPLQPSQPDRPKQATEDRGTLELPAEFTCQDAALIRADHHLSVVLVHPEMPQNTGNIIRLCAATGASLHLVRPLGFVWNDKKLRRSAMDYIAQVSVNIHADIQAYQAFASGRHWLFSAKAQTNLYQVHFQRGDRLVFGSESSGLPEDFRALYPHHLIRIPMLAERRCLNLSSAAAVGLYEAIRQVSPQE
ncbi:MAG: tRNA (cytidine(34)-2'-O)-methyltransferase [Phycisphaerae bacterium]